MLNIIDITPSPRILRTLGEIPFQPWQCIAELVDNSIDAFTDAVRAGIKLNEKKISVNWSSDSVGSTLRTIEIIDTALGMELDQLQNAARAGYSSNDPINNLGLFGMGFNIATARLGENTRLLSATPTSPVWTGIEIDFAELIKSKSYAVRVVTEEKRSQGEHGTKICISRLKGETYSGLRDQETQIRKQLENVYSTLLGKIDIEIFIQGKRLSSCPPCVWSSSRYVTKNHSKVPAIIEIDRDLGVALFDVHRNAYLSWDEQELLRDKFPEGTFPDHIKERHKRLKGWFGIQRYANQNDFGIDFIRNGRKILIKNKDLFSWEHPMTGTSKLEYPVELGSTVGGRIVGEIHVDYLLPTYQKNEFDKTDPSWRETIEALRGVGPILPQDRKSLGFSDANNSPLGLLVNAYRRVDPGTKCLYVERSTSTVLLDGFKRGESDYISDDKWWRAAQESDKRAATNGASIANEVDRGIIPSDTLDEYEPAMPQQSSNIAPVPVPVPFTSAPITSSIDSLIKNSEKIISFTGPYSYSAMPPLNINVWELGAGGIVSDGEERPCIFFQDGVECDFVYNPRHHFLAQFPIDPRQLLCIYLAEKFKARDRISDIGIVYADLVQNKLRDLRVDRISLQEKATGMFERLRGHVINKLATKKIEALNCIHESSGEVEETIVSLLHNSHLMLKFQNKEPEGIEAIDYVPFRTLLRLVDRFPEDLFDGNVFAAPYRALSLNEAQATDRARSESKDRIMSYLKDALWVIGQTGSTSSVSRGKDELARCSHSINFLSHEIID